MPRVTDLPALRTAARERADVREAYIGNAQLNRLINAQLARLYRLLVKVNKDFYYDEQTVSVVAGTADYALAADFWRVLGVDVQDGTNWYSLLRYNFAERNRYQNSSTKKGTRYRVQGNNLRLAPNPQWSGDVRVTYIPAPPVLTDVTPGTSDQWDGFAGFEELAVVWCVIAIKNQQEEDVQAEILESKALIADIHNSASTRDDAEPPRVRDVSAELAGEAWPWWND